MPAEPRHRVTSHDVAAAAGVSQATVSRAMRGGAGVTPELRERVLAAAERLGYTPNGLARNFGRHRAETVGVVVADLADPFSMSLLDAIHSELVLSGYRVTLIVDRHDRTGTLAAGYRDSSLDGVISTTASLADDGPSLLRDQGVPVVLAVRSSARDDVDAVVADDRLGGTLAAQHLVELGHRRFGVILGPDTTSTSVRRDEGFRAALTAAGLDVEPALRRAGAFTHESGYANMLELLAADRPPTAVLCASDVIALGALEAADRRGVRVPEDLSIVGFDDTLIAGWSRIQLTTVRVPIQEMGRLAARRLVARIAHDGPPLPATTDVFPTDLIRRGTTAAAAAGRSRR
jgi:LacI family transcriptional regulator